MFVLKAKVGTRANGLLPGNESNPVTHLEVKLDGLVEGMVRYCQELDGVN